MEASPLKSWQRLSKMTDFGGKRQNLILSISLSLVQTIFELQHFGHGEWVFVHVIKDRITFNQK